MIGQLKTVVLDAPDIKGLADFYVGLAGLTEAYADDEWITLTGAPGFRLAMQLAPDHIPPRWPDPAYPQQGHLEIATPDREEAARRAESLGARRLGGGESWHVLADPAGHTFCLYDGDVSQPTIEAVTIDCADAAALRRFYTDLLGPDSESAIGFQQVDDYHPPRWPDPAYPQQFHIDVLVDDIETTEPAALAIGATRLPGEGGNWRVYADPQGHPFCLTWTAE